MQVYIKDKKRRKDEFQFFMHDFVDECKKAGIESVTDILPSYKYHIRSFLRRCELGLYQIIKHYCPKFIKRNKAIIITANGVTIADNIFPYYFNYEIIPMLWDVWPSTWFQMYNDLRRFDCKTVIVTVKSVAEMINSEMPGINALWVPEGITTNHYNKGKELVNRPYDVLEMGRQMKPYHKVLCQLTKSGQINGYKTSDLNPDGTLNKNKLMFKSNEELYSEMPKYKIMVCFPQCDTNPFRGGNVETLTQRYWEAMLSGCLMIGRAPQELIDLIGYNPVIDVNWDEPEKQLQNILKHITEYQELANKNYQKAMEHASWGKRMPMIKSFLNSQNYQL